MQSRGTAVIVTVGSELTEGLRVDTNTAHIARELSRRGFTVTETLSVGDNVQLLADVLRRLASIHPLVVTTGGLGPTHDDVTRDAASAALGVRLAADAGLVERLRDVRLAQADPAAAEAVMSQALVLEGAEILQATSGTAPGQIATSPAGLLVLLPGPPAEMHPMLTAAVSRFEATRATPAELGVTGMSESDVQYAAQRALADFDGITLTVLAKPGDVHVLLIDDGAGESTIARAADRVAAEIGEACYATDGSPLAAALLGECRKRGLTLACAESCTGGLISAAITDVEGASDVFLGGMVSYADEVKIHALGVSAELLERHGAVSEPVARAMAEGVRKMTGADLALAVTGIAGPSGETADKPVGLVWFALASESGTPTAQRTFARPTRHSVRARATSTALDLLRRAARAR